MEATTHVMTHALHYGTSVFEGIRAYKLANGQTGILCLNEHIDRMYYSADVIDLKIQISKDEMIQAIKDTIKINEFDACYIRPLTYFGYPGTSGIRVMPAADTPTDTIISVYQLKNYLPDIALNVQISDVIRLHPNSTNVEAKIGGHYINCVQALKQIKGTDYNEVIMLDYEGNVAEGSAENLFVLKDGVVTTPKRGTILKGITRGLVMNLINDTGVKLVEGIVTVDDLFAADEVFFSGTAVEVRGVGYINDKAIGDGSEGKFTKQLRAKFKDVCQGVHPKYLGVMTIVE